MTQAKILVVDDEKDVCEVTRNFLEKRNYEAFVATTQEEAIAVIRNKHPHIVLLDVRLGSDSGIEVLRKAREFDQDTKFIMVTALDDEESVIQAKSLGADEYITKPFTAGFLNDLIARKIAEIGIH